MACIVHITEPTKGGTISMIALLANQQIADGHEVHFVVSRNFDSPTNEADLRSAFVPQVGFHLVNMEHEVRPAADFRSVIELRKLLNNLKPDVIHLHSSKAGAAGRLASIFKSARVVYSPHCIAFLRRDIGSTTKFIYKLFEQILAFFGKNIIAVANSEAEHIRSAIPWANVSVIENAVDPKDIQQKTHSGVKFVIGTINRISPQKNPQLFAKIARHFKNNPDIQFIWVGDGDPEKKQELLDANVDVKGWIPRKDALTLLPTFSMFLQTSLWEGMPISLIESFLAGVPVVATNVVGNKDVIIDNKTGFLYEQADEAIAIIERLLKNPDLQEKISQAGKEHALSHYTIDRLMRETYQAYGLK